MRKVRFGLIGYGKVAHQHAQAIKNSQYGTLVAVCGRNADRRDDFAAKWQLSSRRDVAEMVSLDQIDAVVVVTPHPQHHEHTLMAIGAGCHVLVEKPMALTEVECNEMIQAATKANKVLSVVSQRRWHPPSKRIRKAIDQGQLGTPAIVSATALGWRGKDYYASDPWRGSWEGEGGGVCINQAPHLFDLIHWYMGPVSRVYSEWDNVNHPYIEVEDTAVATIRFASGGMGSILVSNSQDPGIHENLHVHGANGASVGIKTDGGARATSGQILTSQPSLNDLWTIRGEEGLLSGFQEQDIAQFKRIDPNTYYFTCQIDDFAESIINGRPPLVTGKDGRETVCIIEGIYRSGRTYLPVSYS
ncbi:MAG: Gfo/Idh/MocA family oxidoreductase [Sphaerochaetaceae bacterium]|nr:Gfo/Idh/MocA family oxidoreductase [Sphaerochaetaceae bacterium]